MRASVRIGPFRFSSRGTSTRVGPFTFYSARKRKPAKRAASAPARPTRTPAKRAADDAGRIARLEREAEALRVAAEYKPRDYAAEAKASAAVKADVDAQIAAWRAEAGR